MQPLRWGIIGLGRFGTVHARVLSSLEGIDLAALCTRDEERLTASAREFGVDRVYRDYRQLLADPYVEVVSITTHWQDHFEIALAALDSGKHVLLEKPMAATGEQCRRLCQAASSASGMMMVAHVCRFDPRVTLAERAIRAGRVGRIVSLHAKRNLPRAPGSLRLDKISPLMGDGVHDADLMMWMTGTVPARIYGRTVRVENFVYPDIGWAMLEFGSDAVGVIETVWCLPRHVPTAIDARLEVVGTDGMLAVDCGNTGLTILDGEGLHQPDTAYWPLQHGRQVGALAHELTYFAGCVRRGERPNVITLEEAARAVMVMEKAEESARLGQPLEFRDPFE